MCQRPDMDDLPHTEWKCEECGAVNSCLDGDCQFCDGPVIEPDAVNDDVQQYPLQPWEQ